MRAKFNIYADLYRRCCYKNITVWRVVENKYSYSYSYSCDVIAFTDYCMYQRGG
jgi:hypothetical protein